MRQPVENEEPHPLLRESDIEPTGNAAPVTLDGNLGAEVEFEDTPLPRLKLFHDDDEPEQGDANLQAQPEDTDTSCPLDDWNIDLDAILPDSPFSSPKRTHASSSAPPPALPDESSLHDWHPSSVPRDQVPPQSAWVYGEGLALMPPVNPFWAPADQAQPKFPNHMVHAGATMDDLSHSMAFLAMSHMGHALPGPSHFLPDKFRQLQPMMGSRAFCTTCRQQQVAVPNSQCSCCQQLLCQTSTHVSHLVQDHTQAWQFPVHAYVRASPQ